MSICDSCSANYDDPQKHLVFHYLLNASTGIYPPYQGCWLDGLDLVNEDDLELLWSCNHRIDKTIF